MNVTGRSVLLIAAGLTVAVFALSRSGVSAPFIGDESEGTPEIHTESQQREREGARIRELLFSGRYDSLDGLADSLRHYHVKNSIGRWKLRDFYMESFTPNRQHQTDAAYRQIIAATQEWTRQRPQSITARVALGEAWAYYAGFARGEGWASQVAEREMQLMHSREDSARAALHDISSLPYCPGAEHLLMRISRPPELLEVFDRATRRTPEYEGYYVTMANLMMPRWYGSRGSVGRMADSVTARFGDDGKIMSARMAWVLFDSYERLPPEAGLSWSQAREGMLLLRSRYPESREILNAAAAMAWSEKDLETARPLIKELGERYDASVWHDPTQFAQARAWLQQEQQATKDDGTP